MGRPGGAKDEGADEGEGKAVVNATAHSDSSDS